MIICVEGIDGAGKNTLVSALRAELGAESLAFPRYAESVHAQLASRALYGQMGDLVESVYGMATLFALDRHGALSQLREYENNGLLVLDRYVASNAAYSAARLAPKGQQRAKEVVEWVYDLEFEQLGLPRPHLQVLLDTAPQVASARAQARERSDATRTRDQYERDGGLQERTYGAYRELARQQWAGPWLVASEPSEVINAVRDLVEGK